MNHTVTLETARKLKEARIEFETIEKVWIYFNGEYAPCNLETAVECDLDTSLPAPILTELHTRLPEIITHEGVDYYLTIVRYNGEWHYSYMNSEYFPMPELLTVQNKIECEAAAQLLLTLKEKGLLNE